MSTISKKQKRQRCWDITRLFFVFFVFLFTVCPYKTKNEKFTLVQNFPKIGQNLFSYVESLVVFIGDFLSVNDPSNFFGWNFIFFPNTIKTV